MRILRYFFSSHFEKHILLLIIGSLVIGALLNITCLEEVGTCSGLNIGKWLFSSSGIFFVMYIGSYFGIEFIKKDQEFLQKEADSDPLFKSNIETTVYEFKKKQS